MSDEIKKKVERKIEHAKMTVVLERGVMILYLAILVSGWANLLFWSSLSITAYLGVFTFIVMVFSAANQTYQQQCMGYIEGVEESLDNFIGHLTNWKEKLEEIEKLEDKPIPSPFQIKRDK